MIKVLVFGTFDGIHEGHREFFRQALTHGDHVIVAVAQDDIVLQLKHRLPKKNMEERIEALDAAAIVHEIVPGDLELCSYEVVKRHRPHVIALGYDQHELKHDRRRSHCGF